jgi:transcription initiation factor TFIIE subunit alpha
MKLSPKLLQEAISEIAGEDVVSLVNMLKDKKNVSEFKLAEDLKEGVNIIRNRLYRLHDINLVSFTRKKDKKKGWYIYYWTFNTGRLKFLLLNLKKQRLLKLKDRLAKEKETQFYICSNQCMRLDFDQAMNFEFKCPECGQLANLEDNRQKIESIEREIALIEEDLKQEGAVKKTKKPRPVKQKEAVKKQFRKQTPAKKKINFFKKKQKKKR